MSFFAFCNVQNTSLAKSSSSYNKNHIRNTVQGCDHITKMLGELNLCVIWKVTPPSLDSKVYYLLEGEIVNWSYFCQ